MKKTLLILALITITNNVIAQDYQYLGNYTSNGTPLYLVTPSDVVSIETLEMISNSLPESYPVPDYNPQYISSGYDTDLRIEDNADVWVTFVSEGAGYRNVLGFYTYDLNNPPTTAPSRSEITIIFPNVSALGSGGGLKTGDKVKIGTFEAGTGIGWVLLANAWSSSAQTVGNALWDLYSNPNFNPEADEELRYHNVLLADPNNERIILGFEDIRRDRASCDNDFNDAIFYVTANPYEAINTTNFADVSESNNVTSAYNGGLESNGKLATLIAKRNFKRKVAQDKNFLKELQPEFKKNLFNRTNNTNSLIDYLPETGMYNTETATVSSPDDLLGITNATEVFSVDYYQGTERVSAVLATATENSIYDHSKVICDRLNSSSLEDIRTVTVRGHKIISAKIKRPNGIIENTLSFSIKLNTNENELFSFWNIDQYPNGNFQNYQIWGSSFSQVFTIANYIIDKHTEENGLISTPIENVIPNVFVKSGSYSNGQLNLKLINKTNEISIDFEGNLAETEVSDREDITNTYSLTGNYNDELIVDTGVIFDIGFSLQTNSNAQKDALYLADGPWGLDYLDEYVELTNFNVTANTADYSDEIYEIDRNPSVYGNVKGNINLFRHLLPGDQTLEINNYNHLNFSVKNNLPIEIVLMQDDDRAWENRIRYTIPQNSEEKSYSINLLDFKDGNGNSVNITNIKTIVYSVIGDYTNFVPFNLSLKNVNLSTQAVLSVETFNNNTSIKLSNYPNPFLRTTTIKLPQGSNNIQIKVYDLLGRFVDFQRLKTDNSKIKILYNAPNLKSGVYKYLIKDDANKSHSGTFIIK